jgi:hypothetical protein
LHSPLFQDVPDEIDETWQHGVVIGGMACRHLVEIARSYKKAADELVRQAFNRCEPHELDFPIFFLYRHSIELYLKVLLDAPPATHDLNELIQLLEKQFGSRLASWIKDRLRDFHEIDQRSDAFRYASSQPSNELWIDFKQLQMVMDRLVRAVETQIETAKQLS